ncbi:MAG: DNA translocase FtsK 4TM domain-containing protein [Bdellovibrionota bacterium]
MNVFFKKFRQDLAAIGWLFLVIFVGLALFSFNPKDPSINSIGRGLTVFNACGPVGSFLADALYQFLGIGSWILPLSFLRLSWACFWGEDISLKKTRYLWAALLTINLSCLLSLYWPTTKIFSEQIYLGGLIGLSFSKVLLKTFNSIGLQVLLWSVTLVLVVFYSEKTLRELAAVPRALWTSLLKISLIKKLKIQSRDRKQDAFGKKSLAASSVVNEDKKQNNETPAPRFQLSLKSFQSEKAEEKVDKGALDDVESGPVSKRKVVLKAKPPRRIENWEMPKISLLEDPPAGRVRIDEREIKRKAEVLVDKLKHFNIEGQIVDAKPGPLVTMFEFKPNADVKLSKITELQDDLSLALSSESLRVIAPIPGRDVVGFETSNAKRETVYYKDLLAEDLFWNDDYKLPIALGRQVNGDPKIVDLRKMPHLLVAGTTGSGKSVLITSIITGLLFRHSPKTLRLILIDPKQVDLAAFGDIPHLIMPPVTEPKKAVSALKWAIREMEKRYKSMSKFGARGLESFNEMVGALTTEQIAEHEKINSSYEAQGVMKLEQYYYTVQPYIVIVVEEFGDLMAVDKQNVEQGVVRLAQMARACGLHLILAMQSPRKEVVTGLIKTNIPGRIGLKVASKMDSRIILDEGGAERLLPNGDMLFLAPGISKPMRHHGPFLSEKEINNVASFWAEQSAPEYDPLAMKVLEGFTGGDPTGESSDGSSLFEENQYDEMYDQILSWASEQKEVSASLLQRRFRLGYPRAARIIEIMEKEGVVGPANGSKARQVLVNSFKET